MRVFFDIRSLERELLQGLAAQLGKGPVLELVAKPRIGQFVAEILPPSVQFQMQEQIPRHLERLLASLLPQKDCHQPELHLHTSFDSV